MSGRTMSRKTTNLKKRMRILEQRALSLEAKLRVAKAENAKLQSTRQGDGSFVVRIKAIRDWHRPGRMYAFQMTVDFDLLNRLIFREHQLNDCGRVAYDIEREMGEQIHKMVKEIVESDSTGYLRAR